MWFDEQYIDYEMIPIRCILCWYYSSFFFMEWNANLSDFVENGLVWTMNNSV